MRQDNQFFFQNIPNNEICEIFKILTFTTQRINACSPWTACSVFDWKYHFWCEFGPKTQIIRLSWNILPRLIQICRNSWGCSLFLFLTVNTFLGKLSKKIKIVSLRFLIVIRLMWIWRIQYWYSFFSIFDRKCTCFWKFALKIKIVFLSWNLESRLIWIWRIRW